MLILILIDVQYSKKTVFSFEKGLNPQNHSSSGSLHLVQNRPAPPPHNHNPLPRFEKPCIYGTNFLPTQKSPTFKDMAYFFPKIRFFPGFIQKFLQNQKFFMKFHKNTISCFLEKVVLINWLTDWQWCFHKTPFCLKTRIQQY